MIKTKYPTSTTCLPKVIEKDGTLPKGIEKSCPLLVQVILLGK